MQCFGMPVMMFLSGWKHCVCMQCCNCLWFMPVRVFKGRWIHTFVIGHVEALEHKRAQQGQSSNSSKLQERSCGLPRGRHAHQKHNQSHVQKHMIIIPTHLSLILTVPREREEQLAILVANSDWFLRPQKRWIAHWKIARSVDRKSRNYTWWEKSTLTASIRWWVLNS